MIVTLVELLGGSALVLGLWTRWAAMLLAIDILVAIFAVHLKGGFFVPDGIEVVLTLIAADIALALVGPGNAAVDTLLGRRAD